MAVRAIVVGGYSEHPRAVREIISRCRQHDVSVFFWAIGATGTNPWAQEWEEIQQEHPPARQLAPDTADFVLDPCLAPTTQRLEALHQLRALHPTACWLRSGLTETATACAHALNFPNVVAFNGLPGLFGILDSLEIAPALTASEEALQAATTFFTSLGFRTEIVQDRIGLVIPRILAMLVNEGAFSVLERVADPNDIDTAMRLAMNYPKGILQWADDVGLDTVVAILDALYTEYHQERYRACVLLRQYVRARRLGRHVGHGFHRYG
ncbi:MAG: 3-hydroxyacyl-CoA dehydrogenase family protein [Candidatus Kapabacteria bacterium]|nr:3-hydroxyacyl-CoA dehydrogenase family protein [Candidatus Kapabacteria bacterium]MCS7169492.1 3-hydroxyacyl-CoA dehydrogenase family protein [Candidatus Kapabacteria bacterium]MDW8225017.1 3-hydroxyacyl-CoA dehydrogenase family protein [Bacteroidota bacterium]